MYEINQRAKDALKSGMYRKNFRFEVQADEENDLPAITIDNDHLVAEKVFFDERMCSTDDITFGLCEGTLLEFQYFDEINITGRRLQAFIDVQYYDEDGEEAWATIPMGWYDVDETSLQFETGIKKVVCYNKLRSKYFDHIANEDLKEMFGNEENVTLNVMDMIELIGGESGLKQPRTVDLHSYSEINGYYRKYTSGNLTFRTQDATTSPINYTILTRQGKAWNSNIKIEIRGRSVSLESVSALVKQKYIKLDCDYSLGALEQSIKKYIVDLIDKSNLSVSGEQFVRTMALTIPTNQDNAGWTSCAGISLGKYDYDTHTIAGTEYYSDVCKENNASFCNGKLSDFEKQRFNGYTNISVFLPFDIAVYSSDGDPLTYGLMLFRPDVDSSTAYTWQVDGTTYRYPYFKLPDGKPFPLPYAEWSTYKRIPWIKAFYYEDITEIETTKVNISTAENFTLRDLASAVYEINCQYGKLDRVTDLFSGVSLNNNRLFPSATLAPRNDLYPVGDSERTDKATYSKLWTDSGGVRRFRYLIVKYKGLDEEGNETDKELQRTVYEHGTDNYNMTHNWLLLNKVWSYDEVAELAEALAEKLRNVSWFPFEMWGAGLPYLDTGDEIEITSPDGTYTSYVLRRELRGIQNLEDELINGTLNIF